MFKIRSLKFNNHKILGNLSLDFTDRNGNAVDTVIIAGDNGTGKSTILNILYTLVTEPYSIGSEINAEIENISDSQVIVYSFEFSPNNGRLVKKYDLKDESNNTIIRGVPFAGSTYGIFSEGEINFRPSTISVVTSQSLDSQKGSRRSDSSLPSQVKQLLVDIKALDDSELAQTYKEAKATGKSTEDLPMSSRIDRFTNAFNKMFENLSFEGIVNTNNYKEIKFNKYGKSIPIDQLSSGEKQIIYRGGFLLKDAKAMNGAFVFFDEPEISLHPNWQKKILDYYKNIFSDENGKQTSQIFVVTHSPFIIHNDNRRNDKVIVLSRNQDGDIVTKDKPSYYKCDSDELIRDAFSINDFSRTQPTVYLEGRTDEKYFNKALEVYGYKDFPLLFKWVGFLDENNQEFNTGDKSVEKTFNFIASYNLPIKNFCLTDCDTNKATKKVNNVTIMSLPKYPNSIGMEKGIENALILDDLNIDISSYNNPKNKSNGYGIDNVNYDFEKMRFCNDICAMDDDVLISVFGHLKETIDLLKELYDKAD